MANRTWFYSGALAAAILAYQLFCPGFVGLADNGDFPRLAAHFSLCPADGWDANRFRYFVPSYTERMSCHWESEMPSAARVMVHAARIISPGPVFPIRSLGALHAILLVALTAILPPLLLFTDLANTAYFNSFFLDGFALLALLAVYVCARRLMKDQGPLTITLYTIAGLLLVASKLQHAALALPLAIFLVAYVRWHAALSVVALLGASAFMSFETPRVYKDTNLWNSVFVGLAPNSPTALAEINLSPAYSAYINHNAYEFPTASAAEYWETRLGNEMSYTTLARYYSAHPGLALSRIAASAHGLQHLRPDYLGNTQPGTPANTQSHRFDFFSTGKSFLFSRAPYLALVLYAACAFVIPRPLALLLLSMAAIEFLTSTFADSVLDYRHHALLQQIADLWLITAAIALPGYLRDR